MRALLYVLFWLSLVLWVAAVIAPVPAAISAFITIPSYEPVVPEYAAYFNDDAAGMGRLLAGFVTDPIFRVADLAQWFLASATFVLSLVLFGGRKHAWALARWCGIGLLAASLALVVYHNTIMGPRMADSISDYRAAARKLEPQLAAEARDRFDADHRLAEPLFGVRLLFLLGAVTAFSIVQSPQPNEQQ